MNAITTPPFNFDKRVEQYVRVRDHIASLKEKHKDELKPFSEMLDELNTQIVGHLETIGVESVRTAHGTAYRTRQVSATIADMSAFWTHVVTQGDWDLLDKRVNKTAVQNYIAEQNEAALADPTIQPGPPPGVNYSERYVAGVRRS